jgi:hypothetical protein
VTDAARLTETNYHAPYMMISPEGVSIMASPAAVGARFTPMPKGFKVRCYARSEVPGPLHEPDMSEHIALLSVSRVRYTIDRQELERLGETYTFRKTEDGWKIAVATIHDPDTLLRLT